MVETLANSLPNPDIHDLHPKPSTALSNQRTLVSTAQLLQSTDDTALLDAMMLDPSLLLRTRLEEQSSLKIPAQPEAAKLNTEQNRSPSPLSPAVSSEQHEQTFPEEPAQSTHGPSMFLNTLHNFHMHNLSATQDDSRPPFTEDKPSKHDTQRQPLTLSTIGEAALPGHATPAKGKAKKDSKVEEMMSEDGASLKEFAAKSNEQTSPRPRELPFKAGSARPRWR
ncbi:hypothetical protein N0V95_007170 [Ascochyta clinopodiicola]|nr:hypothetical protein N0V95_007170 [Ascochyta clinopodiicola]